MDAFLDFFTIYIIGSAQILTGFYFLALFLQKKVKLIYYILFMMLGIVIISVIPSINIAEFFAWVLLLTAMGIFVCHADWKIVILYISLIVGVMKLSYGIFNSLISILYPVMISFDRKIAGIAFIVLGNLALLLAVICYRMVYRYFLCCETMKTQYVLLILIPILMIFLMGEHISSVIYGNVNLTDGRLTVNTNHYRMLMLQLLGMASLFSIMFAYRKLQENFRLSTELSLLEQEEHYLNQYVEEAKEHYEKTKSFRHDIKNHVTVVKELLQNGNSEQALNYIGDMKDMTEELSFPCSTNNPVADILLGNKLGIAKSLGIDVSCSLQLTYPCFIRDIDFCIILSNALDNAIHACKRMDLTAEKYIHVTGHIQGDFILMEIENSFQEKGQIKKGTGLSNIKAVAEKYQGSMSVKTQENIFILSILLIIPQQPETISQQIG
ncbi:MAG: GHKL domain-containing protein [Lachnospiraceae bacterium]|nr:GHKL domain-containing protein [Lachnospiraceae bacterium]